MARKPKEAGTRDETQDWIRNPADEMAFKAGMRFDPERAKFACDWMEEHCYLYEGEKAGTPMVLLPCWREFFSRLYGWVMYSDDWEAWIRRFNRAAFWSAKKNGKSPDAAAHNLYLLCGDGEQGQKVYQGAANGEQAKIPQRHSINMVRQSPMLSEDCKINNTTMAIVHVASVSLLDILSGTTGDRRRRMKGSMAR